ncbi:MAG: PKD domain-containing protein [Flavobacteriales bacterium]|nr:PKD domain-containing protein [Flavobacteriales bacterium]
MKNPILNLLFLVAIIIAFGGKKAEASHALGAEITYECLGGDQYRIRLVFYRDCGGIAAPTAPSINISSSCGNQSLGMTLLPPDPPFPPFDQYLVDYELPVYCQASNCGSGNNPGIQEYVYEATTTLPPCSDWTMSYDLCCRSASINTINAPGSQDIYVSAFLNNQAAPCNSSPQFDVPARGFICLNQDNTILATATDPDGDMLVYSLYTPWYDPNASVSYLGGFSQNNPLSSTFYNFNNGTITTHPTSNGQITVIGVMVEEYRNGVLIGRVVRDMQVRVINNCPQNPGSDFDIDQDGIFDADTFVICTDNPIQLDIYLNNTLPNLTYGMVAENLSDFPGATFNTVPNGSAPGGIVGQFVWLPGPSYVGTTQTLVMTAFDNNCPVVGYSNFTYQFTITGLELDVDIDTVAISCTDSVEMNAIVSSGTPPYTFVWNDGYVGPHRWVTEGLYVVEVTDNEGCTGHDSINVYYVDDPQGAFFDPPGACVDSAVHFVDQSFSNYPANLPPINIVDWEWDFGDGTVVNGVQNPSHAYDTAGLYQVQLVVTNDLGCRDTAWSSVWANPPPNVGFEFENVCQDTLFTFTDLSTIDTGQVVGWGWDFGDGSQPVQSQNTTHQFSPYGYYNVTLVAVSDSGCPSSLTQQVYAFPLPTADFSAADVCYGTLSTFNDLSTVDAGTVEAWQWDFGDQTALSNLQNAVHSYSDTGTFDVTLIVTTDSICRDTITQSVVVHPAPTAGFVNDTVCAQLEMTFTDTSTVSGGSIVSWNWYFGDSGQSTDQNPVHIYDPGGQYIGSLVVETDLGCVDSVSKPIIVYPKPTADFNPIPACQNDENVFVDQTVVAGGSAVVSWDWDFGDNAGTSTDQSPVYLYDTSGVYTVTLITETDNGCLDTASIAADVYVLPIADFTFHDVCLYDAAVFQNTSSIQQGTITDYHWDFGNGNVSPNQQPVGQIYPQAGFYDVELLILSNNGCRDTMVQTIEIFPVPTAMFTYDTVCYPLGTSFTDLSSVGGAYNVTGWIWKFGDGTQPVQQQNPIHNYGVWGDYFVQLSVVTDSGCEADTTLGPVRVYPKPVADFSDQLANCLNDTTVFEDLSTIENGPIDSITNWNWNFTDGYSSNAQDTSHVFLNYGFYNVELSVTTNHGCQDTVVHPVEIYPLPEVKFTVDTNFGCQPFHAWFTDLSTIPSPYLLSAWQWNFGDEPGTVSTRNPDHIYYDQDLGPMDVGVYSVSLQVTSANGCVSDTTYIDYMTEYPKPDALFSVDPMRADILFPEFRITDQASPNVTDWLYDWGDNATSTIPNPVHEYADTGYYDIIQYVTTQFGCKDTAMVTVKVDPDFRFYIPSAFKPDSDGKNDEFFGSGIGIVKYRMRIYDRWGEQIFESNEYDHHWDGTYKGQQVQEGVYVYQFNILDVKGEPHIYRGGVTLFR